MVDLVKIEKNENGELRISSRSIAEMSGKRHSDTLRAVRDMEESWVNLNQPKFTSVEYVDKKGEGRVEYLLTKTEFLYIASKFNNTLRGQVILRWEELENESKFSIPTTLSEALLLAGRIQEEKEQLAIEVKANAPKVEFYDQVTGSSTCFPMGDVAKVCNLGIGRNIMFAFLRDINVLMTNNTPYQKYIDCGYFRVIESKYNKPNGDVAINLKTVVFQKGIDFIIKSFNKVKEKQNA
jgi:anti-repressor protein